MHACMYTIHMCVQVACIMCAGMCAQHAHTNTNAHVHISTHTHVLDRNSIVTFSVHAQFCVQCTSNGVNPESVKVLNSLSVLAQDDNIALRKVHTVSLSPLLVFKSQPDYELLAVLWFSKV